MTTLPENIQRMEELLQQFQGTVECHDDVELPNVLDELTGHLQMMHNMYTIEDFYELEEKLHRISSSWDEGDEDFDLHRERIELLEKFTETIETLSADELVAA